MKIDSNYGIIPDTQSEILSAYLADLTNVFPNANSPDDPTYVIASVSAKFDEILQESLQKTWNLINSNTASGLGLDILANTILNLFRKSLTPSSIVASVQIQNLISYCDVTLNVTVSGPQTLPIGFKVYSSSVTPSPDYATLATVPIAASGEITFRVYSTDVATLIPISSFNSSDSESGVTINDVTNLAQGVLGTATLPADWQVTASSIANSPVYTPGQSYTYSANGTYNVLLYSDNLGVRIAAGQLNTGQAVNNVKPTPQNMIGTITNVMPNVLGSPEESDAQFSARRKYYLNIEGQTYNGIEKAILNVGAPALNSVFVEEVISDEYENAIMIIEIDVVVDDIPVVIPVDWEVTVSTDPTPSAPYKTNQSFTFLASGTYYIPVFSTDETTEIGIGEVTGAVSPVTGVTIVGNLDPSILQPSVRIGSRGYRVYLDYPLNGPDDTLDTQDIYLQKIASACFEFHPFGTNFYAAMVGATTFNVNTPYSGYTSSVILNPLQIVEVAVTLSLVYNINPQNADLGIFDFSLITSGELVTQLLNLINTYFRSKTLPTDMVFTINELSQLIQQQYEGIVSLNNGSTPFTFGIVSPPSSGLTYIRKPIGYVFNLLDENFNFTATNKDLL